MVKFTSFFFSGISNMWWRGLLVPVTLRDKQAVALGRNQEGRNRTMRGAQEKGTLIQFHLMPAAKISVAT
jgi:hypothetical protein